MYTVELVKSDPYQFRFACFDGKERMVRKFIEDGLSLHRKGLLIDSKYPITSPLHAACEGGNEKVVGVLLDAGADINFYCCDVTPLLIAVWEGREKVVELLLERGANPNLQYLRSNATPLHIACQEGYETIASMLIRKGVDVNAKKFNGFTPLHLAKEYGHSALVDLLQKAGLPLLDWRVKIKLVGTHQGPASPR